MVRSGEVEEAQREVGSRGEAGRLGGERDQEKGNGEEEGNRKEERETVKGWRRLREEKGGRRGEMKGLTLIDSQQWILPFLIL